MYAGEWKSGVLSRKTHLMLETYCYPTNYPRVGSQLFWPNLCHPLDLGSTSLVRAQDNCCRDSSLPRNLEKSQLTIKSHPSDSSFPYCFPPLPAFHYRATLSPNPSFFFLPIFHFSSSSLHVSTYLLLVFPLILYQPGATLAMAL